MRPPRIDCGYKSATSIWILILVNVARNRTKGTLRNLTNGWYACTRSMRKDVTPREGSSEADFSMQHNDTIKALYDVPNM